MAASSGQVSDMPSIAKSLGALMGVARQDALMGREETAQQAQQRMVQVLQTFSQRFSETCEQQTLPAEVALALQRQNALMGTGIDVTHCANRRLSATLDWTRVRYRWENCSVAGGGDWNLTMSGFLSGRGRVEGVFINRDGRDHGIWYGTTKVVGPTIHNRYTGITDDWAKDFEIIIAARGEISPSPATAPNDAGPNARPNGWPRARVPDVPIPKSFKVGTLRMMPITIVGDGYQGAHDWIEGAIQLEDRPCTPQESSKD